MDTADQGVQIGADLVDRMCDWRRSVHQFPELSLAEYRTTALIRAAMSELDCRELPLATPTGAAFVLDGGPGPTVLVRADIDALPVTEKTGLAFASQHPGVMHACGHDAHVAIVLGLGRLLAAGPLPGTIVLLFQPAEEILSGAAAILEGGLLRQVEIDVVLAIHVIPMLPIGQVAMRSGTMLAGAAGFQVRVDGNPGHGAVSSMTGDALAAASSMVAAIRRSVRPPVEDGRRIPSAVVCQFAAGTAPNVIPESAELRCSRDSSGRHQGRQRFSVSTPARTGPRCAAAPASCNRRPASSVTSPSRRP